MLKEKYFFKRNANKLIKNGIISFLTSDSEIFQSKTFASTKQFEIVYAVLMCPNFVDLPSFYVFQSILKNPLKLSSFGQKSNKLYPQSKVICISQFI